MQTIFYNYTNAALKNAVRVERRVSLLFKKIKAITGYSIIDFINLYKLKKAALRLAANPQINISEVSFEVGFNDPKYFSRVFRKVYGVSPSEYFRDIHKCDSK